MGALNPMRLRRFENRFKFNFEKVKKKQKNKKKKKMLETYLCDSVHWTAEPFSPGLGQFAAGLQLDFDQLGGAEDDGREEGRRAAGHRVAQRVHLLGVARADHRGHHALAQPVADEQHRVLGHAGHHGGQRAGVQALDAGRAVRVGQTVRGPGVHAAQRLQLGLDRVQRLSDQHDGHAGQRTGQQVGRAVSAGARVTIVSRAHRGQPKTVCRK